MGAPHLSLRLAFGQPPYPFCLAALDISPCQGESASLVRGRLFLRGRFPLGLLAEKPQWGPCRHVGAHLCVRPARPCDDL